MPERREIGIFQTSAEWDALGAYQTLNRRQDSRGGTSFFSLPGDLLGLSTMGTLEGAASPSILADVTAEQRRAFLQYGGFGERRTPGLEDDITSAFSRRQRLISANAAYAPVYRAIMQNSSFAGLRPLVSATPFMESDTGAPLEAPVGGPSLYELLQSDTDTAHRRTAREAWTLFEEGEYRRAARTFESALTLEPGDAEVRIGEFMSYAAVGSIQTAAVLMRKFNEIEANPFAHDVRVRERFADVALVDGLLRDGRLAVDSAEAGRNPNLTATYVLLLWYLGEKDAAVRGARALAREAEAADYRDWPAKMDAARAALSSSTSR